MKPLWNELRPVLRHLAAFSFFINLLFLVPALFTLQVFDRVLSTHSQETRAGAPRRHRRFPVRKVFAFGKKEMLS